MFGCTVAEWAKGALAGMAKGAPFSLCLTKFHYAIVALSAENTAPAGAPGNVDMSKVEVLNFNICCQYEQ